MERKREKMGSVEKEARGLGVEEEEAEEEVGAGSLMAEEDSLLKVERGAREERESYGRRKIQELLPIN